jgi:hypothetical protein
MIRLIDNTLETALDTRDWLAGLQTEHEHDEDISHLVFVLDALIVDYRRVIEKRKLDEHGYYGIKNALTMASILLEGHLTDHALELTTWSYDQIPTNAYELIAVVLNDAVMQFTESTSSIHARRRGFQPLSDDELRAVLSLL